MFGMTTRLLRRPGSVMKRKPSPVSLRLEVLEGRSLPAAQNLLAFTYHGANYTFSSKPGDIGGGYYILDPGPQAQLGGQYASWDLSGVGGAIDDSLADSLPPVYASGSYVRAYNSPNTEVSDGYLRYDGGGSFINIYTEAGPPATSGQSLGSYLASHAVSWFVGGGRYTVVDDPTISAFSLADVFNNPKSLDVVRQTGMTVGAVFTPTIAVGGFAVPMSHEDAAVLSGDPEGVKVVIDWGDGTTGPGVFAPAGSETANRHTYAKGGVYTVTFTLSGTGGGGPTVSRQVKVPDVDLIAKKLDWDPAGGAKFDYVVEGGQLPAGANPTVKFYWATGPTAAHRIGGPLFTATLDQTTGTVPIPGDKLVNLPFQVTPARINARQNLLLATHLIAVADPDNQMQETREDNNVAHQILRRVVAKPPPDFYLALNGVPLNHVLLTRFMNLAAHLVGGNYVTQDITLNEGVRDPKVAHRWSTSWKLRHPANGVEAAALLSNLRALPRDRNGIGRDLDGNDWYYGAWENGLVKDGRGNFTPASLVKLWQRIQANAWKYRNLSAPHGVAAEGYPSPSLRRLPNIYRTVSPHVSGQAIDATIHWRGNALFDGIPIGHGGTGSEAAKRLIASFGLRRPTAFDDVHFQLA